MAAKKRTASPAQLRALARGRAKLKLARKRGTVARKKAAPKRNPSKLFYSIGYSKVTGEYFVVDNDGIDYGSYRLKKDALKRVKQLERNSAPKRRVRRTNPDRALMRTRTLTSGVKAGKTRLSNPSMYVVYDGKRYFDGAGWTVAKKHAAHYTMEKLAKLIGQKIADATNKSVYVVSA